MNTQGCVLQKNLESWLGNIKFEKDNISSRKMIIAVWDSKSNSAVYTIWLGPEAIIGVGDRKSGVHAAPSK